MKPTKMRNMQIYAATQNVRSRQLGAPLAPALRKKHERRSVRVVVGDTVKVTRGEYADVEGKVSSVSPASGRIAIEGVKKEKGQGEKFDVMIHASNVLVTSLNTDDSWRVKKLKEDAPAPAAGGAAEAPEPADNVADAEAGEPGSADGAGDAGTSESAADAADAKTEESGSADGGSK